MAAQERPSTHTVVDGDTLWDLAQEYYGDPFDWRVIWQANQEQIEDPNLILPGQVLAIPDGPPPGAPMAEVDVSVEEEPRTRTEAGPGPISPERTVFYRDTTAGSGVVGADERLYRAVPRDVALSAPWLVGLEEEPAHSAVLEGFAGGSQRSETPRSYDRVRLDVRGATPSVGTTLRTYHVTRVIEGVGRVVTPTGLLSVTDVTDEGVVAVVTQEYDRIELGDLVGPLPDYDLEVGEYPEEVMNGPSAMIMGFAGFNELQDIGSVAFLDLGSEEGIVIGDEFEYLNPRAGSNVVEGRLQVVGVRSGTASARIVEMDDAVFEQGIVVRLARKMR